MTKCQTQIIHVDPNHPEDELLLPAAAALRRGELVAFPTETVYGLGANALDPAAVAGIFEAKGRPGDNPLIVHIASIEDLPPLVRAIPPLAVKLFRAFSPGPLTLILPKAAGVPDQVTAGLDTVAVRIPAHPVARRLIELAGVPVAAPSANRSGRPSPTRGWHVEADLKGRISYIVEAGKCQFGLESTVVDLTSAVPAILRPGAITAAAIRAITGELDGTASEKPADLTSTPRAPGMKYRHYAPKARVMIAEAGELAERGSRAGQLVSGLLAEGKLVGVFVCRELLPYLPALTAELALEPPQGELPVSAAASDSAPVFGIIYAEKPEAAKAGAALFDAMRRLDQAGVDVIVAEGLPGQGIGAAYMNRLRKAAGAAHSQNLP